MHAETMIFYLVPEVHYAELDNNNVVIIIIIVVVVVVVVVVVNGRSY